LLEGSILDFVTKEKRSKIMAAIHSKDTVPEVTLRKALWAKGLRFWVQYEKEKIDVAFPAKKVAVFVDGCFWHGCPIHSHKITTNETYWKPKLGKNKERDKVKTEKLKTEGWTVLRFWEHELTNLDAVVNKIQETLQEKQALST
jgi:DNA mismatch endonuclease (patch repair protein)